MPAPFINSGSLKRGLTLINIFKQFSGMCGSTSLANQMNTIPMEELRWRWVKPVKKFISLLEAICPVYP
jgi:hypothetical protein